ncbi:uncharacterized protein LTR77_002745 [Saxophila tyrrhenica]|uniref:Uncharacterized protein n=1 Tax=Saxophila tyrrhenica TaxID=1690608 RepID=A0AAV9PJ49_9PEZI|nr:hypothetical protein LTR77_002745 [Saxophila tyrrhenica]
MPMLTHPQNADDSEIDKQHSEAPAQHHPSAFEELPQAVRQIIIKFVLVAHGDIKISHRIDKAATETIVKAFDISKKRGTASRQQRPDKRYYLTAEVTGLRKKKLQSYSSLHNPAIIFLSKSIHSEAAQVLYGNNSFRFISPEALTRFAAVAKHGAHFLKSVSVEGVNLWSTSFVKLHALEHAAGLRRLHIKVLDQTGTIHSIKEAANTQLDKILLPLHRRATNCSCSTEHICTCVTVEERERYVDTIALHMGNSPFHCPNGEGHRELDSKDEEDASMLRKAILGSWKRRIDHRGGKDTGRAVSQATRGAVLKHREGKGDIGWWKQLHEAPKHKTGEGGEGSVEEGIRAGKQA